MILIFNPGFRQLFTCFPWNALKKIQSIDVLPNKINVQEVYRLETDWKTLLYHEKCCGKMFLRFFSLSLDFIFEKKHFSLDVST